MELATYKSIANHGQPEEAEMNKDDLAKFLVAAKQVNEANTASPEAARNLLKSEGYLNKDGSVADHYKSARTSRD